MTEELYAEKCAVNLYVFGIIITATDVGIMIITWLFYFTLFLALIQYAIYKGRRRRLEMLMGKLRGPKCFPLIGMIHMCFGSSGVILKRAKAIFYHMKSPIALWVGPFPIVLITDPENFQIVSRETTMKPKEYALMKDLLGEGLITANGEKWKQRRRCLNPAFNVNLMNIYFLGIFNECNAELIKSLDSIANSGEEINLWDYVFKCTCDTICVTAMDHRNENTSDEEEAISNVLKYGSFIETASRLVTERMLKVWLHPRPFFQLFMYLTDNHKVFRKVYELPLQIIRKKKKTTDENNNNNNNNITTKNHYKQNNYDCNNNYSESKSAAYDNETNKPRNFIDILLNSEVFRNLTEKELAEEVVNFITGGSESSAITICFTLLMLAQNPDCQDRINQELMTVFNGDSDRPVELDDLANLPYMEQCIKETLRRFPPVPTVSRKIEKDIVLADGEILPAGARAILGIIGIHLNEKIYKEPFKWEPERFSPNEEQCRHPCSYVPFALGPRSCIGSKYAIFAMKTQLATILRKFQFTTNMRRKDIKLSFDIFLRNESGFKVYVTRKNTAGGN